jgi:PTS system nitrogen regulatory IIA component
MQSSAAMPLNIMPDMPTFLTTDDVARMLNISPRTVCLWAELGKLPAVRIGKLWRFRRDAIERYLEKLPPGGGVSCEVLHLHFDLRRRLRPYLIGIALIYFWILFRYLRKNSALPA